MKEWLKEKTEYVGKYLVLFAIVSWAIQPLVPALEAYGEDFEQDLTAAEQEFIDFYASDFGRGAFLGMVLCFVFCVVVPKFAGIIRYY